MISWGNCSIIVITFSKNEKPTEADSSLGVGLEASQISDFASDFEEIVEPSNTEILDSPEDVFDDECAENQAPDDFVGAREWCVIFHPHLIYYTINECQDFYYYLYTVYDLSEIFLSNSVIDFHSKSNSAEKSRK